MSYHDYYNDAIKLTTPLNLKKFKANITYLTDLANIKSWHLPPSKEIMKEDMLQTFSNVLCLEQSDSLLDNLEKISDVSRLKPVSGLSTRIWSDSETMPVQFQRPNNLIYPKLFQCSLDKQLTKKEEKSTHVASNFTYNIPMNRHKIKTENLETLTRIHNRKVQPHHTDRLTPPEIIIECLVFEGSSTLEREMYQISSKIQSGGYRWQRKVAMQAHHISLLGTNTLSELAIEIKKHCRFSKEYFPITENQTGLENQTTGEKIKDCFFLIEENFYLNYHESEIKDTSRETRKWLLSADSGNTSIGKRFKEKYKNIDDFKPKSSNLKIEDLVLRLGFPYLFVHQGTIEKLLVFNDIRALSPYDCLTRSYYPVTTRPVVEKVPSCCLCKIKPSTIQTINDELADDTPAYWCQTCYKDLHFDQNGKAVANFESRIFNPVTPLIKSMKS